MIEKLNDWSYKSFRNYTGPDQKFNQKNIIFGYNGKGKTSLSEGIKNEYTKNKKGNDNNLRYFNKNYIKDNLVIEDSNNKLKGVKATFSKENVDITKEIKNIESLIQDTSVFEKNISKIKSEVTSEIDKIFTAKKGTTRIQKKNHNDIHQLYQSYMDDLLPALKIVANEKDLKDFSGDMDIETKIEDLRKFNIFTIPNITKEEANDILSILSKKYTNESIPTKVMLDWLNVGLTIHNDNDYEKCFFCNNENINLKEIEEKVKLYFENEKQNDSIKLESFIFKIKTILEKESDIRNNLLLFSNLTSDQTNKEFNIIEKSFSEIKSLFQILNKKQDNFSEKFDVNFNFVFGAIEELNLLIKNLEEAINKNIENLTEQNNKINVLVKGSIALNIKDNSLIIQKLKELKIEEENFEKLNINNIKHKNRIDELIESQQDISDFADFLNNILLNLGFGFELKSDEDNYYIKLRNSNSELILTDISEGERNLLALLFFYYEMFNDEKFTKIKSNIDLIIIDDPISSLDNNNRLYVINLIKQLIEITESQIFILTHSWEDFCDISYATENKNNYSLFEIKKIDGKSTLTKTTNNEPPHKHDFKELYEFSNKKESDKLTDCEMYHYPNIMRKVLEKYLEIKVPKVELTVNKVKIALCGNVNNSSNQDNIQIPLLISTCNIYSHKSVKDPNQTLKSANYLIRKIKEQDKNYFIAMTE